MENEQTTQTTQTTKLVKPKVKRIPNPTGKGGFQERPQDINPLGKPKNSLKSYVARKLAELSDEEKDSWLKEHNIAGIDQWKMGEGNPQTDNNLKIDDTSSLDRAKEIYEKLTGKAYSEGD